MVMDKIKENFMSQTKEFWLYFVTKKAFDTATQLVQKDIPQNFLGFEKFRTAVNLLFDVAQSYVYILNRLQMLFENNQINLFGNFNALIAATLHSQLPNDYNTIIYQFYRTALNAFTKDDIQGFITHDLCKYYNFKTILHIFIYVFEFYL